MDRTTLDHPTQKNGNGFCANVFMNSRPQIISSWVRDSSVSEPREFVQPGHNEVGWQAG